MSSIEKLQIQGIRSFGAEERDKQVIRFSSPLTLILGQNGCGKTTIIEALKYVTCGELPANTDNGSGFVHDPKLSNLVEVYGQVKLKCNNIKNKTHFVSRTVKVTQKAKKLEFKSCDATITDPENRSISGRCADIDAMMCNIMGVSKAVLTNVIFCHQEDSAWPLEKGKKMKDKFDEIFGITDYNKCLDHIRQEAKTMDIQKQVLKKEVDCNSKFWEEAKTKQQNLADLETKLTSNFDSIEQFKKQMQPIDDQLKQIRERQEDIGRFTGKLESAKNNRKILIKMSRDLENEIINKFEKSKEELIDQINSFEEIRIQKDTKLENLKNEKDKIIKEEQNMQSNISQKHIQLGRLKGEDESNSEKIGHRNSLLKELVDKLSLPTFTNTQYNEGTYDELLKPVEIKIKEFEREIKKIEQDHKMHEKSLDDEILDLTKKQITLQSDIKNKNKLIESNKNETNEIHLKIDEINKSADTLGRLRRRLDEVNEQLNNLSNSFNADQCKRDIQENIIRRNMFEEDISKLDEEIKKLQEINAQKMNLDRLYETKRNTATEFNSLKEKSAELLKNLLNLIPENNFQMKLKTCITKYEEDIRTIANKINEFERELSRLNEQLKHLNEQIRIKNCKLLDDEEKILEYCMQNDNLDECIAQVNAKIEYSQDVKGTVQASQFMYKKYVEKLNSSNPLCPLCRREFKNQDEITLVVDELNKKLKEFPGKLFDAQSELDTLVKRQSKGLQLKPIYESMIALRDNELPKLKSQKSSVELKIEEIKSILEQKQNELFGPQTDLDIAKSLLSDATLMDQRQKDLKEIERNIKEAESKMPKLGINKTLSEAISEQDILKTQIKDIRKIIEDNQTDLADFNEKLSKLQVEKSSITSKQLQLESGALQRHSFEDKLLELKSSQKNLIQELNKKIQQLSSCEEDLRGSELRLKKLRSDHEKISIDKRKKLSELEKDFNEARRFQDDIMDYEEKGGKNNLNNVRNELADLNVKKDNFAKLRVKIEKEIEEISEFINKQEVKKSDLKTNLKLMETLEDLKEVESNIAKLEGRIGEMNVDKLRKTEMELDQKLKNLKSMCDQVSGRISELQSSIAEAKSILNREHYKTAEEKYKNSVIDLKVTSVAIEDLKNYEKAMDWAMIYFHKERMKMINTIVRDLWRQIYRGNDIDSIEIKTDETNTMSTGRRSYNYRVVQTKNGTELDMPGRCSAGQKVLACLIIRMALAETFSRNCGILALDEPTTNLDKENIESLSNALAEIVTRRSIQKNFQLLLITHDEEFIKRLARIDKVEYYILIDRDSSGKSRVQKKRC